jgi:hypothetical protein
MIATRFRSVVSAAIVAAAALVFYLISLNVAAERNELRKVERQIAATKTDLRYLKTEFGTRARLSELERWNVDVLALQAPAPRQYMKDGVQLASLVEGAPAPAMARPAVVQVAQVAPVAPAVPSVPAEPAPAPSAIRPAPAGVVMAAYDAPRPAQRKAAAKAEAAPPPPAAAPAPAQPMLRQATYVRPSNAALALHPEKVALLDDDLLGEIRKVAKSERKKVSR